MGLFEMKNTMQKAYRMQKDMKKMQKELEKQEYPASAADGQVKVVMNGTQELVKLSIEPNFLNPSNARKLESAILEAVNEANKLAQAAAKDSMQSMMGGMDMGALSKMLGM